MRARGISYDTGSEMSSAALRNIMVSLNAQNVLDKEPPYVAEFNQNFDSSITSMLQRVVTAPISKKAWTLLPPIGSTGDASTTSIR